MKHKKLFFYIVFALLFNSTFLYASVNQVPQWYAITAYLNAPPVLNKTATVTVKITSYIGNINKTVTKLTVLPKWQVKTNSITVSNIKPNETKTLTFSVIPKTCATQALIIVETALTIPKKALLAKIRKLYKNNDPRIINTVLNWPDNTKNYQDISFILSKYESVYPLTNGFWPNYYNNLSPAPLKQGPVYYDNTFISDNQAQTNITMYKKLQQYLKNNRQFARTIKNSGINLENKKFDMLNSLYVLAERAFFNKKTDKSLKIINTLQNLLKKENNNNLNLLKIATGNLKAIILWQKNNIKQAKNTLKKTLYANRKNNLQRYTLRNLGLLYLATNNKKEALNIFNLALTYSNHYTLLNKEIKILKQNN